MATTVYDLPLDGSDQPPPPPAPGEDMLPQGLLTTSLTWFPKLRFLVAALLLTAGIAVIPAGDYLASQGLFVRHHWLLWLAGAIGAANLVFVRHARETAASGVAERVRAALWIQIVFDLLAVTAAVHFLGSLTSFASFTYLFHIVIACILFSRKHSLLVALLVSMLFIGCVAAERLELIPSSCLFAQECVMAGGPHSPLAIAVHVGSAIGVWLTVWYLASRVVLSTRRRDIALAETNRRLVQAGRDRATYMLRTTHEIKAPFAAIHANAQLLQQGHCGELPEAAVNIVDRMEQRCRRLSEEIKQMLQLTNLRSKGQHVPPSAVISLPDCLEQCLLQAGDMATRRGISIERDFHPVSVVAVQDHLHMMFENLISNAIAYSRKDGTVTVSCGPLQGYAAEVSVQDRGIGIPKDKLPRIFEDYYRTQEAVNHNKSSTGLGLAVVRRIAKNHGLRITVETELEQGTTFRIAFPEAARSGTAAVGGGHAFTALEPCRRNETPQ